ncbi:2'-5' RNA ligase family protein [Desertimonas flava]|uniref:2'-5' RNA ligase family protein n=1 Tax=Desertimonas flava TaxID=2064846 RepID=UPI000E34AFE4|nr:2'-5' RNA ligase family protein [Desertimonas flava]
MPIVALLPSDPDALAVDGGDPADQLHVTIAYLGDTDDGVEVDYQLLGDVVDDVAASYGQISAEVSGVGTLGDQGAVVAFLQSETLERFHDDIGSAIDAAGIAMPDQFPSFIAHLTLGYPDDPAPFIASVLSLAGTDITFDRVGLIEGAAPVVEHELAAQPAQAPAAAAASIREEAMTTTMTVAAPAGTSFRLIRSTALAATPADTAPPVEADTEPEVEVEVAALAAETAAWEGVLVVEGPMSGDRRRIEPGALTWRDLPLPLMVLFEATHGPDTVAKGSELAGRIDWIERRDNGEVWGGGILDLASEAGSRLYDLMDKEMLRGVSVDLDSTQASLVGDDGEPLDELAAMMGQGTMNLTSGRIMGATACVFPAFQEAVIWLRSLGDDGLFDDDVLAEGLVAAAGPAFEGASARVFTPWPHHAALVASAAGPVAPPLAWFQLPDSPAPDGIRVSREGQVYGFATDWDSFHIGVGRRAPRSKSGYRYFCNKQTLTAEGTLVATGPLIMDTVHPSLKMNASDAQAFYAHTGCAVADVAVYETAFGIYVAGAVRPDATPEQVRALRGSDISPDWRPIGGGLECVGLVAVNVSGFVLPMVASAAGDDWAKPGVPAMHLDVDTGEVLALVAAGMVRNTTVGQLQRELADLRAEFASFVAQAGPVVNRLAAERRAALAARLGPGPRRQRRDALAARFDG